MIMTRHAAAMALLTLLTSTRPVASQTTRRNDLSRKLHPCRAPNVDEQVLCGRFEVPEVRGNPGSRRISLNIVLLPAVSDPVAPDPLVFLAGGGVVPATRY